MQTTDTRPDGEVSSHLWPVAHRDALVATAIIDAYVQLRLEGIEHLEVRTTARCAAERLRELLAHFERWYPAALARAISNLLARRPGPNELPALRNLATQLRRGLDEPDP